MPLPADRIDRIQAQWRAVRPDVDVTPQGVFGRLHRVGDLLRERFLAVYGVYGLGEGEFDVLAALRRAGEPFELAAGDLARHTMVTTGAVSKRLDRLEASGLVRRRTEAHDARRRIVGLTDEGRRVIDVAFTEHMRNEAQLIEVLTPAQREQLQDVLRTWLHALEG